MDPLTALAAAGTFADLWGKIDFPEGESYDNLARSLVTMTGGKAENLITRATWVGDSPMPNLGNAKKQLAAQFETITNPNKKPDTNAPAASASLSDQVSNYFLRGTIIILGFIFVAVGLAMFKVPVIQGAVNSITPK